MREKLIRQFSNLRWNNADKEFNRIAKPDSSILNFENSLV